MSHIKLSMEIHYYLDLFMPCIDQVFLLCQIRMAYRQMLFLSFINLWKIKDDLNEGDRLIVCFDTGKKTFRSKLLDQYKQQRKPIEPELKVQIPISREMLDAMNISHCELEGYEADDLAGSLAKYAEKLGDKVDLYTSDKDYFQLISPNISVNF